MLTRRASGKNARHIILRRTGRGKESGKTLGKCAENPHGNISGIISRRRSQHSPNFGELLPKFGKYLTTLGTHRTDFGQLWTKSACVGNSCRFWPGLAQIGLICAAQIGGQLWPDLINKNCKQAPTSTFRAFLAYFLGVFLAARPAECSTPERLFSTVAIFQIMRAGRRNVWDRRSPWHRRSPLSQPMGSQQPVGSPQPM